MKGNNSVVSIYGIEFRGKVIYVGKTKQDIFKRLYTHITRARSGSKEVPKLFSHIRNHYLKERILRWDERDRIYIPKTLELCHEDIAYERESFWIAKLDTIANGCNVIPSPGRPKGCRNPSGKDHYLHGKRPAQHIIDASVKARTGKPLSAAHRAKISAGNKRKKNES